MQYKLVALMGKAGSGKDTIMKEILKQFDPYFHEIVSCTTRAPRDYEVEGVNYHFLSLEDFTKKVVSGEMLESTEFNGWFYGTSLDALSENDINIGVFNPAGIRSIMKNPDIDMRVFYITASDKTRLLRQLNREDFPNVKEIIRRYGTDEQDFLTVDDEFDPQHIGNDNGNAPWLVASRVAKNCADWMIEVSKD